MYSTHLISSSNSVHLPGRARCWPKWKLFQKSLLVMPSYQIWYHPKLTHYLHCKWYKCYPVSLVLSARQWFLGSFRPRLVMLEGAYDTHHQDNPLWFHWVAQMFSNRMQSWFASLDWNEDVWELWISMLVNALSTVHARTYWWHLERDASAEQLVQVDMYVCHQILCW